MATMMKTTEGVRAADQLRERKESVPRRARRGNIQKHDADTILAITTRMVGEHLGVTNTPMLTWTRTRIVFDLRGELGGAKRVRIVGHYSMADFGSFCGSKSCARPTAHHLPMTSTKSRPKRLRPSRALASARPSACRWSAEPADRAHGNPRQETAHVWTPYESR